MRATLSGAVPRPARRGPRPPARGCGSPLALGLGVLLALGAAASSALASPWTLPKGTMVVSGRFDYEQADEEWLDKGGDAVPFSLRGDYQAVTYTVGARLGLTDRLELELQIPLRQVSYTADPVILLPRDAADPRAELDYYQENVLDLSRTVRGLSDIRLTVRHRIWSGLSSLITGEVQLKTPTGYDPPAGTFGERPRSSADFLANAGTLARPENVQDDVTLGDGQVDIRPALLFGWAFSTGTFARLDVGYAWRLGGAGDQVFGGARVGQSVGQRLLFFTGVDAEVAVEDGRRIGVSVAAIDPTLPARDYVGTENLLLREVRLDRDRVGVPLGAIVRLTSAAELNLGTSIPVWGRNTSVVQTYSVGIALRTDPVQ